MRRHPRLLLTSASKVQPPSAALNFSGQLYLREACTALTHDEADLHALSLHTSVMNVEVLNGKRNQSWARGQTRRLTPNLLLASDDTTAGAVLSAPLSIQRKLLLSPDCHILYH